MKHLYDDPEYVARITSGIRAHVDQRRGSTYEEVYGVEKAEEYKQKLRETSPARLAQFQRKETEPERLVREMLEGLGVTFQQEAPLGYYTVDFLLEDSCGDLSGWGLLARQSCAVPQTHTQPAEAAASGCFL